MDGGVLAVKITSLQGKIYLSDEVENIVVMFSN